MSEASTDRPKPKRTKHFKLIAFHLGASEGVTPSEKLKKYAEQTCENVMYQEFPTSAKLFRAKSVPDPSAELGAIQLVKLLEDHYDLNCGCGSNLNINGQVECDASMMSERTGFWTGVGAVTGCRNPILLAYSLYHQQSMPRPLGLMQPNFLVSKGARQWMREYCPELNVADSKLISRKAFIIYQKLKSRLDAIVKQVHEDSTSYSDNPFVPGNLGSFKPKTEPDLTPPSAGEHEQSYQPPKPKRFNPDTEPQPSTSKFSPDTPHRLDTVGALVVDKDDNFAAAISSGGILLKRTGRLGHAAVPGAGCWAQNRVAVVTTGIGEHLTNKLLARTVYDKIHRILQKYDTNDSTLTRVFKKSFKNIDAELWGPDDSPTRKDVLFGFIAACKSVGISDKGDCVTALHLICAHNVGSMCMCFMSDYDDKAHTSFNTRSDSNVCIKTVDFEDTRSLKRKTAKTTP